MHSTARHDEEDALNTSGSVRQSSRSGTNLPQLADLNEAVVLGWIRRSPSGLSRVELTRATGLSPQAISNICQRLLDDGAIREAGKASSGFGKPRTMLELDPSGCSAVGVHLDPAVVTLVLLDFLGEPIARTAFATAPEDRPQELLARIGREIDALIEGAAVDRDRVLGVGVASPGPIDQDTGTVLDPPMLTEWHQVAVREQISAMTGLPTLLDKEVIASAVAERWAGAAAQSRDFAFIYLGAGIGAGVVVDDLVLRGVSGNAGDIGRFEVSADESDGAGSGTRALGDMTNPDALVRQAARDGILPSAPGPENPRGVDEGLTELCRRAEAGDERAGAILDRAATRIGGAVGRIANLLDVDTVVFGGTTWSRVAARYLPIMERIIREVSITRDVHPLTVTGTTLGEHVGAIGAACLVLDNKVSAHPQRRLV